MRKSIGRASLLAFLLGVIFAHAGTLSTNAAGGGRYGRTCIFERFANGVPSPGWTNAGHGDPTSKTSCWSFPAQALTVAACAPVRLRFLGLVQDTSLGAYAPELSQHHAARAPPRLHA